MYFSVHKYVFQRTNMFPSAQIYFSVHKCTFQCSNMFQCTNKFTSAQIRFSVHKIITGTQWAKNVQKTLEIDCSLIPGRVVWRAFVYFLKLFNQCQCYIFILLHYPSDFFIEMSLEIFGKRNVGIYKTLIFKTLWGGILPDPPVYTFFACIHLENLC